MTDHASDGFMRTAGAADQAADHTRRAMGTIDWAAIAADQAVVRGLQAQITQHNQAMKQMTEGIAGIGTAVAKALTTKRRRFRSAITGRWVSKAYAKANPASTVAETVKDESG